ncbi:MAG: AAA family ATPase [Clostridia bacterium]|nr:AAA family ATPase [Clostridia bacterium]
MLCSRCKERPAVVFVTKIENNETVNEGLCLKCAKELNIKPISQMIEQLGISDEEFDEVCDQMSSMMGDGDGLSASSVDGFEEGGAQSMNLFQKLFGGLAGMQPPANGAVSPESKPDSSAKNEEKDGKKDKKEKKQKEKEGPKHKYLDAFCQNLTEKARSGKTDPVIGRESEILRVLQILNRRTKNNPCLIGEPGVGKTAIAEGIAQKIASGEAPAKIARKEVWLLDLTALIAGTQFRGQFESRIKGLIEEVRNLGNVILVIDEVHNLVGAGDSEGSMNAANMLKPALSRGEIQVIGATTLTEYRKHIEKDAALERRFQPVIVNEPSIEDSVKMLQGIKSRYETFHHIKVPQYLVVKAVELSERYVTDRYLPDKAIDLLDEACSNATLRHPVYEKAFLAEQKTEALRVKLAEMEGKEEPSQEDFAAIATAKSELIRAEEESNALLKERDEVSVSLEDLALIIELWTGIPSAKIQEREQSRLARFEEVLRDKIKGQDHAVKKVADAVRRSRVSLVPRKRPVSFIFTGPTGVGKTELVKVLAKELFHSPETLIRLDMSEFMEKHSVSRIIGAPPGYVGYDEAGQLTEKVRRKPYSVVLFDEIEKAHPDVLNVLLQILDDGRITDAHGKTVSFEHCILVMTSNAGSHSKATAAGFNRSSEELDEERSKKALSEFLRPEFLNRVDEIIVFRSLPRDVFPDIVRLALDELAAGLKEREIEFICSDAAVDLLAKKSYSAEYGARNVRRVVQTEIEDRAVSVLCESFRVPRAIRVDTQGESLCVSLEDA